MRGRGISSVFSAAVALVFVGACGDATTMTAGNTEGGSGTTADSSTGGSATTPTSSASASGSTGGGSGSESNTMGSNTDPTTGPTTSTTNPTTDTTVGGTSTTVGTASTGSTGAVSVSSTGVDPSSTSDGSGSTGGDTGVPVDGCIPGVNKWTLDAHFDQGVLNNVNHDDPNNNQLQITVDGVSAPQPYMFAAQTNDGWILKIDTVTGKQLARYFSVRTADCASCNVNRTTWYPSRITVDFDGDMYVANRAFSYQGSVTKIAGTPATCLDRNNNGTIETSHDANNDGVIDVNNATEFPGQSDECVIYTQAVGANDTWPRALTLDGKGSMWVGTYNDMKAIKLDITQTPWVVQKTISLPSTPYGFAVRGDYLYSSALGQPVMRVDLTNDTVKTMSAPGNYGITVDQNGIAWFGGSGLYRCDFDIGGNCEAKGGGGMNGVSVDADGQIWGASGGTVYKFSNSGAMLGTANVPNSYGVAIGHDGHPRVLTAYNAAKVDSGAKGGPPGAVTMYNTGIVGNNNVYNYTYTDFTGFASLNVTVKKGEWTVIHDGKDQNSIWEKVLWNDEKEGKIPAGTSITIGVRAANTKDELKAKPFTSVVNGLVDGYVEGQFVEVKARLLIEDDMVEESPVLSDVCVIREGE
jgi:hypothetical protein